MSDSSNANLILCQSHNNKPNNIFSKIIKKNYSTDNHRDDKPKYLKNLKKSGCDVFFAKKVTNFYFDKNISDQLELKPNELLINELQKKNNFNKIEKVSHPEKIEEQKKNLEVKIKLINK
jgi:hypothetical protein